MEIEPENERPMMILLVEDNPGDVYIIVDLLKSSRIKFDIKRSSRLSDAIKLSNEFEFDVVLLDLGLPDSIGLETLKKIVSLKLKAPVIVMTGLDDEEVALASVKEGAQDYLVKNNLTSEGILHAIRYGIERKKIHEIQERNTHQFSILSDATVAINECKDVSSIYETICQYIERLINDITVFPIDLNEQNIIELSYYNWLESFINPIRKIRKLDSNEASLYVSKFFIRILKLHQDGKLHNLSEVDEMISEDTEREAISELLGIYNKSNTYLAGFSRDGKQYGGIIIFSKSKIGSNDADIIEAISNQASLNIQRRYVENELKLSESRYRILFKEVTKAKEALQKLNEELDHKIQLRTRELAEINTLLHIELDEHKQTSERLKESEEKYRLLFTKMTDGFALYEMLFDENKKAVDYRFVSVNPAFEHLTHLKAGKIIGKTAGDILRINGDNRLQIYGKVALSGKSIEYDDYDPGLNKYFRTNAFCPKPGYCAVIIEDITQRTLIEMEQKKAQEQLKIYAADLRDLNATKDKFFGIIAHDLKNPFSGLMGASELLLHYADQFDKENIKNVCTLINDSAKQGHALLENLLEWSRSQTGKLNFNPQEVNIKVLVDENVANLKSHVMSKNIDLQCEITDALEVIADKDMINTILRNLLSNALKFTRSNGKISISANKLADQVLISVKDTGIGISRENINKLFRIDVKYTREGTDQESGTGLGLLLCKEFVEKHGGKIWVESREGKGSEFKFTIPAKNPAYIKPRLVAGIKSNI